ncbi:MAG: 23S rRNA (uracil(1939)-C(5))-methyltransferase RlmD [Gammaproteobacteria bacterium]|nr:23S rRNA (uracil(1939)-C(5))-methyltransferase RlmD [Gammaproteobacteria bacterium]
MARLFKPGKSAARLRTPEIAPTELLIDDLSSDGRGVARHDGKVVFVDGGLPGERIEVAHYRRQKRYAECQVKTVLQASEQRVVPVCEHFGVCGGCQLQHLQPGTQIIYKQNALLEMLQRQQQLQPEILLPPVTSPAYGYRARARFGVTGARELAFRQGSSDQLTAVQHCPVLTEPLRNLVPVVQQWLGQLPPKPGVTHIEFIDARPSPAIVIRHTKPLPVPVQDNLRALAPHCQVFLQGQKNGDYVNITDHSEINSLYYHLSAQNLIVNFMPGDFTQVNPAINPIMIEQALLWLDPRRSDNVADLFCGVGNFTLPFAQLAGRVLGVEAQDSMVVQGRQNGVLNQLENITFAALDLSSEALASRLSELGCNKVLLDPPRAGARFVCEQMGETTVERLVYVSCNPASFVRDSGALVAGGFKLKALRVLDMFPQTAHLETMALFLRD